MKKFISILISFILCVCTVPMTASAATSGKCGDNLTWTYDAAFYSLTISGTGAMYDYSSYDFEADNVAPWFEEHLYIKTINVTDGVTYIGKYAFGGPSYSVLTLCMPQSVTSMGDPALPSMLPMFIYGGDKTSFDASVFKSAINENSTSIILNAKIITNENLGYVVTESESYVLQCGTNASGDMVIPETAGGKKVTKILREAFYDASITTVSIADSVKYIEKEAFNSCENLTSVKLPKQLETLENYAFVSCVNLETVMIPKDYTTITEFAFNCCDNIKDIYYEGNSSENITIGEDNGGLNTAVWHYNYDGYETSSGTSSFSDSGSLSVKYSVAPSYTVTIPSEVTLGNDVTVSVAAAVLQKGDSLNVAIIGTSDANNVFKLTTTEGADLTYSVKCGSDSVAVGTPFLTYNPDTAGSDTVTLSFEVPESTPKFAGDYTGSVTFGISVTK